MGRLHAHFHVTSLSVLKRGGIFNSLFPLNDRNDRNDKETEKSPMRTIARGLWKPCHSCHLCHWVLSRKKINSHGLKCSSQFNQKCKVKFIQFETTSTIQRRWSTYT